MGKEKISVTLESEQVREISDRVGDGYESRSEVVRELIDRGLEYEALERRNDELEDRLAAVIDGRAEHQELVEYVEEERSWRSAPIWTRARWWLTGKPGRA